MQSIDWSSLGVRKHFEAGRLRLRPVLLTSITTVLGLTPVAYGIGGLDPFVQPMALAIGWGLFFATGLTLIIIPCVYMIFDDLQLKVESVVAHLTERCHHITFFPKTYQFFKARHYPQAIVTVNPDLFSDVIVPITIAWGLGRPGTWVK